MSDNPVVQKKSLWFRRALISLAFVCVAAGVSVAGLRLHRNYQYPFGWSHSCDSALQLVLLNYAEAHDGAFPSGEATPEASLSLLARSPWDANAELLRGKTVPKDVVESILARGDLLGPETCGWHYVEGLRKDDDSRIALFWDKVGLGHNGDRLSNGDRIVTRIGTPHETIPGAQWSAFLKEQKALLEELPADRRGIALRNFPE